jgi:hypothetical protein
MSCRQKTTIAFTKLPFSSTQELYKHKGMLKTGFAIRDFPALLQIVNAVSNFNKGELVPHTTDLNFDSELELDDNELFLNELD